MSKPFWTALSELKVEDSISVYWIENTMYINDENDGQASTNTSLFEAYKFSVLINTQCFDYTATDKEVKEFEEQMLDLIDEDWYRIDVWKYIDDISDDFEKLTGIKLGIDDKREVVAYMSEENAYDLLCDFGSATYIAKLLWRYIKGDSHIKQENGELLYKGCENKIINELADEHLQSDDYDLRKFAKALHKECEHKMSIPKNFNEYLTQSHSISEKCYYLLGQLVKNNREYKDDILVGYIDWFGDYEEYERYIYCHIDSEKNEIYFCENQGHKKSGYAFLHDIAFHHLVNDPSRIQEDIIIKFTTEYIDQVVKDKIYDIYGIKEESNIYNDNDWGYNYCHMYCDTIGKYIE